MRKRRAHTVPTYCRILHEYSCGTSTIRVRKRPKRFKKMDQKDSKTDARKIMKFGLVIQPQEFPIDEMKKSPKFGLVIQPGECEILGL